MPQPLWHGTHFLGSPSRTYDIHTCCQAFDSGTVSTCTFYFLRFVMGGIRIPTFCIRGKRCTYWAMLDNALSLLSNITLFLESSFFPFFSALRYFWLFLLKYVWTMYWPLNSGKARTIDRAELFPAPQGKYPGLLT